MLAPSPIIKHTAKTALKPCFLSAVIVCCVTVFLYFIGDCIGQLVLMFAGVWWYFISGLLFSFFAITPLLLGVLNYFNRIVWEQKDSVIIIFKYFSSLSLYIHALKFILKISIKLLLVSLLVFLPCILILILSNVKLYAALNVPLPVWTSILGEVNRLMLLLGFFALMFIMLKYYLAAFIFISNDDIESDEAINMSTIISKRTGGDFFGLVLSFGPWILLSLLIIPLIITLPYFLTSYCIHCHYAISDYNVDVERFSADYAPSFSPDEL